MGLTSNQDWMGYRYAGFVSPKWPAPFHGQYDANVRHQAMGKGDDKPYLDGQ